MKAKHTQARLMRETKANRPTVKVIYQGLHNVATIDESEGFPVLEFTHQGLNVQVGYSWHHLLNALNHNEVIDL